MDKLQITRRGNTFSTTFNDTEYSVELDQAVKIDARIQGLVIKLLKTKVFEALEVEFIDG